MRAQHGKIFLPPIPYASLKSRASPSRKGNKETMRRLKRLRIFIIEMRQLFEPLFHQRRLPASQQHWQLLEISDIGGCETRAPLQPLDIRRQMGPQIAAKPLTPPIPVIAFEPD